MAHRNDGRPGHGPAAVDGPLRQAGGRRFGGNGVGRAAAAALGTSLWLASPAGPAPVLAAGGAGKGGWPLCLANLLLGAACLAFAALAFARVGTARGRAAAAVCAYALACAWSALAAGLPAGRHPVAAAVLAVAALALLVPAAILPLRRSPALAGIDAREQDPPSEPENPILAIEVENICEELASAYGLTARENEILHYLAHGRNAAFIQDSLFLSRNTVKTHLGNIYAKLGVHTQQEIIDLVERSSAGCVGRSAVDVRLRDPDANAPEPRG